MPRPDPAPQSAAAENLKRSAQRLFAERGIDGVSVREIADAAGQKNGAAVGYHFGSKEALVRELVREGAKLVNQRRNRLLDDMERNGGPKTVREVVDALIKPGIGLTANGDEDSFARFIGLLVLTHRRLVIDILGGRWISGYLRCLEHLRRLMPTIPIATQNQRFVFISLYLSGMLTAREGALTATSRGRSAWAAHDMLGHFAQTMTAILEAPPPTEENQDNGADLTVNPLRPLILGPIGAIST